MTSFSESFGLVLVEAETYGLPLVSFTSAQGSNEIIQNGKNGFLIGNRDKEKMSDKLIQLIEDKTLRELVGCNARKFSEKYSKISVSNLWNEFIQNL